MGFFCLYEYLWWYLISWLTYVRVLFSGNHISVTPHICQVHPWAWTLLGLPVEFEGLDKTQIFKVVQFSALGVQYFNPKLPPSHENSCGIKDLE